MASSLKKLGAHDASSIPNCAGKRFGIVVSEYYEEITSALFEAASNTLKENGVSEDDIYVSYVPGAFEMPLGAKLLYDEHQLDGVIALGCVVRGETDHDKYINQAVADGMMQLGLQTGRPFVFGLLTPNTYQQAKDRAGGQHGNKGIECAVAALKMVGYYNIKSGFRIKGF